MTAEKDIQTLIKEIDSPDRDIKEQAIFQLGERKDDRGIYPLIKALHEKNPGIQQAAMNALIKIKKEITVYNVLPLLRENVTIRNIALSILLEIGDCAKNLFIPLIKDHDEDIRKFMIDILAVIGDPTVIDDIIPALADPNPNVRSSAAEALGHLKAANAIDQLIRLLNDMEEEWVKISTIEALGEIGDKKAITALIKLLDENQPVISNIVMESLGKINDIGVIDNLLPLLTKEIDTNFKNQVVKSLLKISENDPKYLTDRIDRKVFFQTLRDAIEDEDSETRFFAIKGLSLLKERAGAAIIIKTAEDWKDKDEEILVQIKEALMRIKDETALINALKSPDDQLVLMVVDILGNLKIKEALPNLIVLLKEKDKQEIKRAVIKALGNIPPNSQSVEALIELLTSDIPHLRGDSAVSLGKIGDKKAISPMINLLEKEQHRDVLNQIVRALIQLWEVNLWDEKIRETFVNLISSSSADIREIAVKGLGMMEEKNEIGSLIIALNDVQWRVRKAAIEALIPFINEEEVKEAVIFAFLDESEQVRIEAINAVGNLKGDKINKALINALEDPSIWVKSKIIEVLANRKSPEVISILTNFLMKETGLLQMKTIWALGELGGQDSLKFLEPFTKSDDAEIRNEAIQAVDKIKG